MAECKDGQCPSATKIIQLERQDAITLQRFHEGDMRFASIDTKLETLITGQVEGTLEVAKVSRRLFVDNGTTSFQTTLDRHNQVIRAMTWAIATCGTVLIGLMLTAAFAVATGKSITIGG